jgi:hypothetical protein
MPDASQGTRAIPRLTRPCAASPVQLAPGWRTGANCDQYPRGDRRLGEACTDRREHTIEQTIRLSEFRRMKPSLGEPFGNYLVNLCRFRARRTPRRARHRRGPMAHDQIAPLTVQEMSALARRFEARAASVLLRDQPYLQSDMRLAARLIYELTGNATTIEGGSRLRAG